MDTTALNIANVMGTVNLLGYVLEEATESSPRVVKALAIYTWIFTITNASDIIEALGDDTNDTKRTYRTIG